MEKQRKSNFELLRIFSMAFIVAGHLACHGIQKVSSVDAYLAWSTGSIANKMVSCAFLPGAMSST